MNRITQRVQALEKGTEEGATIGELLDLLGDDRLGTVQAQAGVIRSLESLPGNEERDKKPGHF